MSRQARIKKRLKKFTKNLIMGQTSVADWGWDAWMKVENEVLSDSNENKILQVLLLIQYSSLIITTESSNVSGFLFRCCNKTGNVYAGQAIVSPNSLPSLISNLKRIKEDQILIVKGYLNPAENHATINDDPNALPIKVEKFKIVSSEEEMGKFFDDFKQITTILATAI